MKAEDERLLWAFLEWGRTQGYALCRGSRHTHGHESYVLWEPLHESAGTLLERFAAYRAQEQGEQGEQGEEEDDGG